MATDKRSKEMWLAQVVKLVLFLLLLFGVAGTFDYWQAWVFFGYVMLLAVAAVVLFKDKVELGHERLHPGPGMKSWDKVFWVCNILFSLGVLIVAVLDSGRYGWTKDFPVVLYPVAYVILTLGTVLIFWAMHVNPFFSSVVRIQKERGQTVIQSGPYAIVRHPGYAAGFFLYVSMPLVFGSFWALVPAVPLMFAFIGRTYLEDRTLKEELPGYLEYTKKVRYRLIPGIW